MMTAMAIVMASFLRFVFLDVGFGVADFKVLDLRFGFGMARSLVVKCSGSLIGSKEASWVVNMFKIVFVI